MTFSLPSGDVSVRDGNSDDGFLVLEPGVDGDETCERGPLERLAEAGQLAAYSYDGLRQPMDTLRDVRSLNGMRESCDVPWKVWR